MTSADIGATNDNQSDKFTSDTLGSNDQNAPSIEPQVITDAGAGAPTARGRTWKQVKFGITSTSHCRITDHHDERSGIAPNREASSFCNIGQVAHG